MLSRKILVAYDGTEQSRRALDFAVGLARLANAAIGVVSVVPVYAGRMGADPWDDAGVHSAELREAQRAIREAGLVPTLHEPFGEIADQIVRTATQGAYDHIVLGSRHLGLFDRLLQGSVSEAVANRAACCVTIVH